MEQYSLKSPTAGNENTRFLKLIAIICMVIDHLGAAFFPFISELRVIGRIAFPLYAWCIVVGAEYTKNKWKYALRLLLLGAISQPCYMLGLNYTWNELNVFATLTLGLLAIFGIQEKRWGSQFWAPAVSLLLSCIFYMDYEWKGITLILLLYAARKSRPALAATMLAFCLFWGNGTSIVQSFFGLRLPSNIPFLPEAASLLSAIQRMQFFAILSLPLILIPTHVPVKLPKWAAYAVYPVHLLIIGLIRMGL